MRWIPIARKHLTKYRIKAALIGVPLLLVAVVLYLSVNAMNSPAIGTVKQVSAPEASAQTKPLEVDGFHDGQYVSFSYPPGYKRLEQKLSGSYVEVISLGGPNKANRQITIGVTTDSLANNSGIVFRRQQKDIYKEEQPIKNGVVFSSKKNGYERTGFISHGEFLATVSVFSPTGYDMGEVFKQITDSLEWK